MIDLCLISPYLAYGMALYCIASAYYLVRTRSVGTPFTDSLTPDQLKLKAASADIRRNIFYQGIGVGALVLLLLRPFQDC